MRFDLLIKGGEVADPGGGLAGRLDIGIARDRIVAVESDIPESAAAQVVDATGSFVTPGLVDLHAHVYAGCGYFGVDPSVFGSRTGVTTWADAGSPGAFNLRGFRDYVVTPATVRVLTWMNLSYMGLAGLNYDEYASLESCNIELFERVSGLNRDIVIGIKSRMGTGRAGNQGIEPLRRARQAADRTELPIMVHISTAPPDLAEVLALLRPGDVVTHAFTGQSMRIVGDDRRLRDEVRAARDRGIIFDIGHGSGSFSFETAEAVTAGGFWPDVLSTDLHAISIHGPNLLEPLNQEMVARVIGDGTPVFSMLTVMSKFLHLGMSLQEVIRASTTRPAEILGLDGQVGTLRPGAYADITLLALDEGNFQFHDIHGNIREGVRMLRCLGTFANGRHLEPRPWPVIPDYIRLVPASADTSVEAR